MPSLRITSQFDSIRCHYNLLYNNPTIYRYGYSDTLNYTHDVALYSFVKRECALYESIRYSHKFITTTPFDCIKNCTNKIEGLFDSQRNLIGKKLSNRYDQKSIHNTQFRSHYDVSQYITGYYRCNNSYDVIVICHDKFINTYDSIHNYAKTRFKWQHKFNIGHIRSLMPCYFDAKRFWVKDRLRSIYQYYVPVLYTIPNRIDSIFDHNELQITLIQCKYKFDLRNQSLTLGTLIFDSLTTGLPTHKRTAAFEIIGLQSALLRFDKQAFVKAGWKIVARNVKNGEQIVLGFIDAESDTRSLENVFLPNGDYEIFVLTSSLFWKDVMDKQCHTMSIRDDKDIFSLPNIYNLRSSISNSATKIEWSSNPNAVDDCFFGIWYSQNSPVDISRQPDNIIWYQLSQTEYQTTLNQNAPTHIAIAVIRPGNEAEIGIAQELFLDWNTTLPKAPHNVVITNK